jgi:hypothetical protein
MNHGAWTVKYSIEQQQKHRQKTSSPGSGEIPSTRGGRQPGASSNSGNALLGEIQNRYEQKTAGAKKICPDYSGGNDRNFRSGKAKFWRRLRGEKHC